MREQLPVCKEEATEEVLFHDCESCSKLMAEYVGACGYDLNSPII